MGVDRFSLCLTPVLAHEGGYNDRKDDRGGPTNLGCTIKTLSDWLGRPATKAEVKALTRADVQPIYKAWYWDAAHCGELPAGVDYIVFDLAINSGAGRAVKFLQRAVMVTPDGVFGPVTKTQVASRRPADTIGSIYAQRRAFYHEQPQFPVFGKGWLKRLDEVFELALSMAKGGL